MSENALALRHQHHESQVRGVWALALVVILTFVPLHWLLFQGQEVAPGVIARPVGPCDVEWFANKGGVLVLGCPHMDMLRLWPLPIQQPWFEVLPVPLGEKAV